MNRIITAIVMLLAVAGGAIGESCYVISVSEDVRTHLQCAMESYHRDDITQTEKHLHEAEKIWDNSRSVLNSLLIHNYTETISEHITTTIDTLQYDKENFPIECHTTTDAVQVIIDSMIPHIDNIL